MKKNDKKTFVNKKLIIIFGAILSICIIGIILIKISGFVPSGIEVNGTVNPTVTLQDSSGNPIIASKVILDGKDIGSKSGSFQIDTLDEGPHIIIIIWDGARYEESFYYFGKEKTIPVQLLNPVNTLVSVWEKNLNKPISEVAVYVDGEKNW
jgi:hypothetical protein